MKKFLQMCLSLLLVILTCCPVLSLSAEEFDQKGSLTITIHEADQTVGGGELVIYAVGNVGYDEDGNAVFTLNAEFEGSEVPLRNPENLSVCNALIQYAEDHAISGMVRSVPESGTVRLENLDAGLYLVTQTETAEGYEKLIPFLISVPSWDDKKEAYVYDVDAYPKAEVTSTEVITPENPVTPATPADPTTVKGNTNTGLYNSWMMYAGVLLLSLLLILLYAARLQKKHITS